MDDDTEHELRNPFPSPPSHYTKYSSHNLKLLALLKDRLPLDADISTVNQRDLLSDQKDLPDWDLVQLEKPRVDWILDEPEPYYEVYGERFPVKEKPPSTLAELGGGTQLYSSNPADDRRPTLVAILKSLLVTYSNVIALLVESPPADDAVPEWQRQVEWIVLLSQNLTNAANNIRPMQARFNLELMMKRQLELRREETKSIHAKCDALEAKLKELRTTPTEISPDALRASFPDKTQGANEKPALLSLTNNDVLDWAENI
ncbi:hypothetical protein FA15DRAFT_699260 [Coprinopsis marcescibilis]|uniref:Mediator of RNA polymerase II transcription subunit 7 n=1 Tax=Coprinopsis marcescibilis TaxID=230819 RepID=A0A5C3LG19_COPMA|nr:hypothetical protein FA15DRAFT_699260 [Coprinopsis marcescibilis]